MSLKPNIYNVHTEAKVIYRVVSLLYRERERLRMEMCALFGCVRVCVGEREKERVLRTV